MPDFTPGTGMVPVVTRWRDVYVGDTITDRDGDLWLVEVAEPGVRQWQVRARRGGRTINTRVDPDDTIAVLCLSPDDPEAGPHTVECSACGGRGKVRA